MRDYSGKFELEQFVSIQEACEILEIDRDLLRYYSYLCSVYPVVNEYYVLGFGKREFQTLVNYFSMPGCPGDIGDPWAECNEKE